MTAYTCRSRWRNENHCGVQHRSLADAARCLTSYYAGLVPDEYFPDREIVRVGKYEYEKLSHHELMAIVDTAVAKHDAEIGETE